MQICYGHAQSSQAETSFLPHQYKNISNPTIWTLFDISVITAINLRQLKQASVSLPSCEVKSNQQHTLLYSEQNSARPTPLTVHKMDSTQSKKRSQSITIFSTQQ